MDSSQFREPSVLICIIEMLAGVVAARQGAPVNVWDAARQGETAHHASAASKTIYAARRGANLPPNKKTGRINFMQRLSMLAAGLLIGAAAFQFSGAASGQSDGWITLVDSSKMGDWDELGRANWAMKDGALVVDKLDGKDLAYLVTKDSYKDFQIKAEFWVSDDANSGIFIRCEQPKSIGGKTCYEVNIFDQRPDPSYGTGAIVEVAKVDPMPKAGGKWNTYEIRAGAAFCRRAQRSEDRRCRGLKTPKRPDRAAIRPGRGEIPQSADQTALSAAPTD